MRFLASGGFADEDAQVVRELLDAAARLAEQVLGDPGSAAATRTAAQDLLDRLASDTFERYGS